jgi:hypothetical protein
MARRRGVTRGIVSIVLPIDSSSKAVKVPNI